MSNEGIMTNVWGPWMVFLHCVKLDTHKKDSKNKEHISRKKYTKIFFNSLGHVLPCKYCRQSYLEYLTEHPIDKHLDMAKLAKWFYDIHNKINRKLVFEM